MPTATAIGVDSAKLIRRSGDTRDPPVPAWAYAVVLAGTLLAYWLPRLFRGFWIDEAGAYWVAHDGWSQVWPKLQIYPGQSIIYAHLSSLFAVDGPWKEAVLRLPSIAGMLAAAWLLYKLAEAIVGPKMGWFAVIPFACAGAIVEFAPNARPYALGLAVMLASFWNLRRWVHSGRRSTLVLYCACSAIVVYFHYLFVLIFAVQTIYLIAARRSGRRFAWPPILLAGCVIAIAAIPLVWQFLTIVRQSNTWKTAAVPTILTFLRFYPVQTLITAAVALGLYFLLHREWFARPSALAADDLLLLLTWLLVGPVFLFAVERIASYTVFATRYLIYALPPFFILLAWLIRQIGNQRARFCLVLATALSAALYVPNMETSSEWRTPLEMVSTIAGPHTPVLLRSGFAESATLDWKSGPRPGSYLFAPLLAYPVRNEIIPVPFFMDAAAEQYLEQEIQRRAPVHGRFCLVADKGSDVLITLPNWFRTHGYNTTTHDTGGIEIILFE